MADFQNSDYVEVRERISKFYERYPDGRIVPSDWRVVEVGGKTFIVYVARAYRTPDDPRPAVGRAWEPFPGPTSFTKDSELMNAETSAVGRALAMAGVATSRSIATAEDVKARLAEQAAPIGDERVGKLAGEIKAAKLGYERLCLILGAVGADAPDNKTAAGIKAALGKLTEAQADHVAQAVEASAKAKGDE